MKTHEMLRTRRGHIPAESKICHQKQEIFFRRKIQVLLPSYKLSLHPSFHSSFSTSFLSTCIRKNRGIFSKNLISAFLTS